MTGKEDDIVQDRIKCHFNNEARINGVTLVHFSSSLFVRDGDSACKLLVIPFYQNLLNHFNDWPES